MRFLSGRKQAGFTLIELLVVIAVIAILASILFPVFAQAKQRANVARCLSNLKQLGTATIMYTDDYGGAMPYPGGENLSNRQARGSNLPAYDENIQDGLEKYIKNKSQGDTVWRCPNGFKPPAGQVAAPNSGTASMGRSYAMNDWLRPRNTGYYPGSTYRGWDYVGLRQSMIQNPAMCILFLEANQDPSTAIAPRNSSPRDSAVAPVVMHGDRFAVVFCDGHVDTVKPAETVHVSMRVNNFYLKPGGSVRRIAGTNPNLPDNWVPFFPYSNYPAVP